MDNMIKATALAAAITGALTWASTANATTILSFGQVGSGSPVTATENAGHTQTTITALNEAITITGIDAAVSTPAAAFFDLNATSVGAATTALGFVTQAFTGTFSITSGSGDTGTNYLSGSFTDAVFGQGASLTLSAADPSETISFTSSVIADLAIPTGLSISFANVTPAVAIDGSTLQHFTASDSATFSGSPVPVPEPASLTILGAALVGLGIIRRRRKSV